MEFKNNKNAIKGILRRQYIFGKRKASLTKKCGYLDIFWCILEKLGGCGWVNCKIGWIRTNLIHDSLTSVPKDESFNK